MDDSKTTFSNSLDGTTIICNQKISKICVTDYSRYQVNLDILTGESLYQVYRSEREIFSPKSMNSFNGVFFLCDQHMIKIPDDMNDINRNTFFNRIIGTIYNVRRSISEPDYLLCDIKIYNGSLFTNCYMDNYRKISLGYNCKYVLNHSKYKEEEYQIIQENIAGNHAALVREGRRNLDFEIDKKVLEYIKL